MAIEFNGGKIKLNWATSVSTEYILPQIWDCIHWRQKKCHPVLFTYLTSLIDRSPVCRQHSNVCGYQQFEQLQQQSPYWDGVKSSVEYVQPTLRIVPWPPTFARLIADDVSLKKCKISRGPTNQRQLKKRGLSVEIFLSPSIHPSRLLVRQISNAHRVRFHSKSPVSPKCLVFKLVFFINFFATLNCHISILQLVIGKLIDSGIFVRD